MASKINGNQVKLLTFKSCDFSVIGYKIEQKGEIDYVSEVWCKICAEN